MTKLNDFNEDRIIDSIILDRKALDIKLAGVIEENDGKNTKVDKATVVITITDKDSNK